MWFGYYPEIIFCHFFCNLNLVIFKCTIMAGDINSLNLLVVTPIAGVCNCSMFCCTLLYVHSSIAIIVMEKRELVALLNLSDG